MAATALHAVYHHQSASVTNHHYRILSFGPMSSTEQRKIEGFTRVAVLSHFNAKRKMKHKNE